MATCAAWPAHAAIGDVPSVGLVGHWMLDDGTGTTTLDASGNGHPATLVNGPGWIAGVAGNALGFSTSTGSSGVRNYLDFPASIESTSFPSTGSLVFWVKGNFATQNSLSIFDSSAFRNHIFVRTRTGGKLQIQFQKADSSYLNAAGTYTLGAGVVTPGEIPVTSDTWTQVAVVWDTTNNLGYIYQNGDLDVSSFWGSATTTWTPNGQLMMFNDPADAKSSAISLDDIALYSRVLSQSEVQAMYAGSSLPAADSVAPSVPASAHAFGIAPDRMAVEWTPASDDVALGGYIVYRNGAPIGQVASTSTAYVDSGLATSTSYSYQVYAYDASGNRSSLSGASSGTTLASTFLFQGSFESLYSDDASFAGWIQQKPTPSSITISTEVARGGSKSVKYDYNLADWTDANTNGMRSELAQDIPVVNYNLGTTYWTGFSEYIPADYQNDFNGNSEILWQYHGASGGPGVWTPPLYFEVFNSIGRISIYGATTTAYAQGVSPQLQKATNMSFLDMKGRWTDWVIESKFDYSNGVIRVWKNGVKIVDFTGPTIYHSTPQTVETGPYFKLGVYKHDWGNGATQVSNRTLYADEVHIGGATATCADVVPSGGSLCGAPAVTAVTIASNHASTTLANASSTATVSFTADQTSLVAPTATINGRTATVVAGSGTSWTASAVLSSGDASGPVTFSLSVGNSTGTATSTITSVTSGAPLIFDKTPPSVFALSSPQDDAELSVGTLPTFAWSAATDAHSGISSYEVRMDGALLFDAIPPSTLSVQAVSAPVCETTHTWIVRAIDALGNATDSSARTFAIACASTVTSSSGGGNGRNGSSSAAAVAPSPAAASTDSSAIRDLIIQYRSLFLEAQARGIVLPSIITQILAESLTPSPSGFDRDLDLGSSGEDVRALQALLIAKGYAIPAGATGYFGEQTRVALARYQAAMGIVPAAGYFGPKTRASL